MRSKESFETTYRRYPFPVLVDFGLALSRLFLRGRPAPKRKPAADDRTLRRAA